MPMSAPSTSSPHRSSQPGRRPELFVYERIPVEYQRAHAGRRARPFQPSCKHHLGNVSLRPVGFWKHIAAGLLQLVGGAVTKGFIAAGFVAVFVSLLGVLPWQDPVATAFVTEWWFRPATVFTAYTILIGAAVWNRRKVK